MRLTYKYNLPFVSLTVHQNTETVLIPSVLIDTGSASTLFSIDLLEKVGIMPESDDSLHQIRGVGGVETVFKRKLDRISLEETSMTGFIVEVGAMDYGFDIQGILGMDFLSKTGAVIDLSAADIRFSS